MEPDCITMVPVDTIRLPELVDSAMLDEIRIRQTMVDIEQFGFSFPLQVFSDGTVHGSSVQEFLAAKRLGRKYVPCQFFAG